MEGCSNRRVERPEAFTCRKGSSDLSQIPWRAGINGGGIRLATVAHGELDVNDCDTYRVTLYEQNN
jgi:hypothetical protein